MAAAGVDASNVAGRLDRAAPPRPRRLGPRACAASPRADRGQRRRRRHRHRRSGLARGPDRHRDRRRRPRRGRGLRRTHRPATATPSPSPSPPSPTSSPGAAELAQGKLAGRPVAVVRGRADLVLPPGEDGPGAACARAPRGRRPVRVGRPRGRRTRAGRGAPRTGARSAHPPPRPSSHAALDRLPDRADRTAVAAVCFAHGWQRRGWEQARRGTDATSCAASHPRLRRLCHRSPSSDPPRRPRDTRAPWPSRQRPTVRRSSTPSAPSSRSRRTGAAWPSWACASSSPSSSSAPRPSSRSRTGTTCAPTPPTRSARSAPRRRSARRSTTKKAEGNQDHVEVGTPMSYPDAPPAFGQHWNMWDSMDRKLYTTSDRPELGELVHNLEHGYTILWYDETIADSDVQDGRAARHRLQAPGHHQPARQVQGRAVDVRGRQGLPEGPARRPSPTGPSAAPARPTRASRSASGSTAPT